MSHATYLWLYLAGALLIPGRPFYTAVYLLGGVYLLARYGLAYAVTRVSVERTLSDERIFLGEDLTVRLQIRNRSGLPVPWLQFADSRPQPMAAEAFGGILALKPGEGAEVSYTLSGVKRGRYEIGPTHLAAGDPFGFGTVKGFVENRAKLIVYPRVSPLPDLGLPARLPMGDLATRRRLFEDPAWLAGTRPYEPGDTMKRVHWTATARAGELVVKQFRHAMLLPCCVAVNLNQAEYDPRRFYVHSEMAIGAAASLSHYLVEQKQQVSFLATGKDPDREEGLAAPLRLPLRQGRGAMMEVLELLARVQPAPAVSFVAAVTEEAQQLPWGTLLCLVTPQETPELAALCARLSRTGKQVLLFVMDGESGRRPGYQVWAISENRRGEVVIG